LFFSAVPVFPPTKYPDASACFAVPFLLLTTSLIILLIVLDVFFEKIRLFFFTELEINNVGSTLIPSFTIVAVAEAKWVGVMEIP